ncbi:MAG TPA: endonuclease/exonuclease/phosphatase family protein [Hymenobacter sp.]|nr:endonuclease/exonuclease/phosphatase family protein [Hymenobacter sp.]
MNIINWNMQGASHSTENKWNEGVLPFFTQQKADICMLQECGAVPASAQLRQANVGGFVGLNLYTWGTDRNHKHILFYPADPNGNRCNLAVVSTTQPTAATLVLPLAPPIWRPVIGMVLGGSFFGSIHAISPNGPDAPALLNQVAALGLPWVVGGDYNRLPASMNSAAWMVNSPNGPTYPSTGPEKALDYQITAAGPARTGQVLSLYMSDHLAVAYQY